MKKSRNPFYRLLGVKSSRPHHYKLLGVPRSADSKQVELAAKARLQQVQGMEPDHDPAEVQMVVAAIEKARADLCDPERRKTYDLKLDAADHFSKPSEGTDQRAEPSRPKENYTKDDLLPPPLPGSTPQPSEAENRETEPTSVAKPVDVKAEANIPLAVPLAPTTETEKADDAQPQSRPEGGQDWRGSDEYDTVSGLKKRRPFSGKFRVRPRGAPRGKRSQMVPLLSMFFFVVGVGGLLFFLFKYMEMNGGTEVIGEVPPVVAPAGNDVDGENGSDTDGNNPPTANPPKAPSENNRPDEPSNSVTGTEPSKDAGNGGSDGDAINSVEPGDPTGDSDNDDGETMDPVPVDGAPDDEGDAGQAEPRVLSFGEKAEFRRLIQRADRNLYQRNLDLASEAALQARALIEDGSEDGNLSQESRDLVELASAVEKMSENLRGFWDQVITSGKENNGDFAIDDSGERFVTVVDTGDDYIIVRSAGENLRYRYLEMPAGLAKDLAESGEKEDVPTWNIQKATFYAVNRHIDIKYRDFALRWVAVAEQDGHDLAYLRNYLRADLNEIGSPETNVRELDRDRLQTQIRDLKQEFEMPSRLSSLTPAQCETFSTRVAEEMDLLDQGQNLKRSAMCELIRQLAIQGGDVDFALESVEEQRVWAKFDQIDLKVDTLSELSGEELDRSNARLCIDSYIRIRTSNQGDVVAGSKLRKLHKRLDDLAKEHGFSDLTRQLGRLERP